MLWRCVYKLIYPACSARAPYCHCGQSGSSVFFHIISLTADSKIKFLNIKCVFWFPLQLLSEIFLILKRIEGDRIKKICTGLHVKYPLFSSDFNEKLISWTNLRKIPKCQILWKSVQWEPSCSLRTDGRTDRRTDGRTDGRTTDRHDEANSRSSQFCERAQKWKRQDSGPNYSRVQTAHIFCIHHQLRFECCSELSEICFACVFYFTKTTDNRF